MIFKPKDVWDKEDNIGYKIVRDLVDSRDKVIEEMELKIKHLEDVNKWLKENPRTDLIETIEQQKQTINNLLEFIEDTTNGKY